MAEHSRQDREPVGSVAEETARLVEALGGWADGLRAQHDATPPEPDPPADAEATPGHSADSASSADSAGSADSATTRCEHCGTSSRAGEALACRLCPVCQGIALLRTVRPETVERLADVAAALSGALRDIATERFGQPPPTPQPPPPRGQRVQDIVVDDEDDDDDQGTPPRSTAPTPASRTRQESTAP